MNYLYFYSDDFSIDAANVAGLDYLVVDLESMGKLERQGPGTLISNHSLEDISYVKRRLSDSSKLLVRINPIRYQKFREEINNSIDLGADALMLPMFSTVAEVDQFFEIVNDRAEIFLLAETPSAVRCLDKLTFKYRESKFHIGLRDLSIALRLRTCFDPLFNGTLDHICKLQAQSTCSIGIGGISFPGSSLKEQVTVPSLLSAYKYYGSSQVILSRAWQTLSDSGVFRDKICKLENLYASVEPSLAPAREEINSSFK